MSLAVKAIEKGAELFFSKNTARVAKTVIDNKPLLEIAKKTVKETGEVVRLRLKPDISIPIRPSTIENTKPSFAIKYTDLDDEIVKGEIGNMALRLEKKYALQLEEAQEKFAKMFPGKQVSVRSKSAASIYSKIIKNVKDKKLTLKSDTDVNSFLTDGIAGRLTLDSLSRKDVLSVINSFKLNGKSLTAKEKRFVKRLLNNDAKLSKAQTKVAQKYVDAIKSQLAEKQSEGAFTGVFTSMLKDALDRKLVTISQLEKSEINPKYIEVLKNNLKTGTDLHVPRFCNYRGPDGLAYFSDNQIREIEKMQLLTGEKFSIAHCSSEKNLVGKDLKELTESEALGIKPSGYTTTQMNFILKDGSWAELQIRGEGIKLDKKAPEKITFGEIEHVDYDGNQGKNTINAAFKPFQDAKANLNGKDDLLNRRTRYKQKCYNYDRILELGCKDKKPSLSKGINKVLSRESMTKLHYIDEEIQKEKMKTFTPYIEGKLSLTA